jgi:HPt (histidine-containing phosphotransfer) domain-containing protein
MVQFFDEDSPPLLEAIRAGIREGDAEQVGRAAHTLKGLAANFNAEPTVAAARRLEQVGQNPEHLEQAAPALAELEREVALLSAALGQYRAASASGGL